MKKLVMAFLLGAFLFDTSLVLADGMPGEIGAPVKKQARKKAKVTETVVVEPIPAPIVVIPAGNKINLVSWDPNQPAGKIVGSLQEGVSTMWDVLRLLSGPNSIGLSYPDEKELWGYSWLWAYELKNPMEDTTIMMDQPGKRIKKGKNPVELYITFNKDDRVSRIQMDLIKKKDKKYVVSY